MELTVDKCEGIPVVCLAGDMRLSNQEGFCDQVRGTLVFLITSGWKQLILDLSAVTQMDSRALGCLVRWVATVMTLEADLRLVTGSGLVLETLSRFKLLELCQVFPDEAAAAASFPESDEASHIDL